MKNCIECGIEFKNKYPREKYCTIECCRKLNNRKNRKKLQSNPELRIKKNKYERLRLSIVGRKRDRLKHNAEEKARYRKLKCIKSDADLKHAPAGSGCLTRYGYRKIHRKGHPNAWKNGDMFEHVFFMSEHLKRPIRKGETVHHKNGIKDDNRIENLELWSSSHPYGQRVEDKILWAKEFLQQYGYDVIKIKKTKTAKTA